MNHHELQARANEVVEHLSNGAKETHHRTLVDFDLDDQRLVENGKFFMNSGADDITEAILSNGQLRDAILNRGKQIVITDFFMNQQKMDGVSLEAHKCFTVIDSENAMLNAHTLLALIAAEQPYFASWIAYKINGQLAVQMINDAWSVRTFIQAADAVDAANSAGGDNVLEFKQPKK